jgi:hypothetical protein
LSPSLAFSSLPGTTTNPPGDPTVSTDVIAPFPRALCLMGEVCSYPNPFILTAFIYYPSFLIIACIIFMKMGEVITSTD